MAFQKGHAKIGGRRAGQPNKIKAGIGDFARGILESQEYRDMLRARAINGTLPPGVEALLFYYAYGKPPQRIDLGNAEDTPFEVVVGWDPLPHYRHESA